MRANTKEILGGLQSAASTAEILGVDKSTVVRIANRCGIGCKVLGRHLFSEEDVEKIRANCYWKTGNPKLTKKNA